MSELKFPELVSHLPKHYDVLDHLITGALSIDYTAQIGRGPVPSAGSSSSLACRICFEALATEVTLTHNKIVPEADNQSCRRTYHLECLVQWARSNIEQQQPVTCPGDRQILLDQNRVEFLRQKVGMSAQLPRRSNPRPIHTVIPFWELAKPNNQGALSATFSLSFMSPQQAVTMACAGFDVGFIDYGVIEMLPLDRETRVKLQNYGSMVEKQMTNPRLTNHVPTSKDHPCRFYNVWLYVQTGRRRRDFSGAEHADYHFVPMSRFAGKILRRQLWERLGGCGYHIIHEEDGPNPYLNYLSSEDKSYLQREARARARRNAAQHLEAHSQSTNDRPAHALLYPRLVPEPDDFEGEDEYEDLDMEVHSVDS